MTSLTSLIKRWPLWLALFFGLYSLTLLWYTQNAQDKLRHSIESRLASESRRRADTFTAYLEDRRYEVSEIAQRYEIESYLANKALGMSQRYGLIANLIAIDDYFKRKREQRTIEGSPVFLQIIFYDEKGVALSEHAPLQPPAPFPDASLTDTRIDFDADKKLIIFSSPVIFKGEYRGCIVVTSNMIHITDLLLSERQDSQYKEMLVGSDGAIWSTSWLPDTFTRELGKELAQVQEHKLLSLSSLSSANNVPPGMLIMRSQLGNTPLSLITEIHEDEAFGVLGSRFVLLSLAFFPIALLIATLSFEKQRIKSMVLKSNNYLLSKEIARRSVLENQLNDQNRQLEQLTCELQASVWQAEAANRAKSDFLATMSHEIRTPMNGILGMAQVLESPNLPEKERIECIRILIDSGQTLLDLLNDILDISKIEAGKFELSPRPCQPAQILHDIAGLFRDLASSKKIALKTEVNVDSQATFLIDDARLRQMLSNLIGNAIKFTPSGEIRITLNETARNVDHCELEFAVIDTGIGIPEDKLSSLFKPFTQVDSTMTRQYGGTGLGLAIVHNLVDIMNGQSGVESTVGKGSRFWFRLKVLPIQASEKRPAEHDNTLKAIESSKLTAHILVAEDTAINRTIVKAALTRLGTTVTFVEDGLQAIEAVRSLKRFDLILMDLRMPNMDGIEATDRIREFERTQGLDRHPIIALTANAYDEDRNLCREHGMDGFLAKPLKFAELENIISSVLHPP